MDRIIFKLEYKVMENEKNGFLIASGIDLLTGNKISVKGYGYNFNEDCILECFGKLEHTKFGEQLIATEMKHFTPLTLKEIFIYLTNGAIKGISYKIAEDIINKFAENTISILDNDINRLKEIDGIGVKTIKKITKSWLEIRTENKRTEELIELGFSIEEIVSILNEFGEDSLKEILKNPYVLMEADLVKIPFKRIDYIAINILKMDKENPLRIMACLINNLRELRQNGDTYIETDLLSNLTKNELRLKKDVVDIVIEACFLKKILKEIKSEEKSLTQLYKTYTIEKEISEKLIKIKNYKNALNIKDLDKKIKDLENMDDKLVNGLSDGQRNAIKESFEHNVNIINGGPGVGKTTSTKIIIEIIKKERKTFKMCAFTGKAAQRMKSATGEDATTIHRLLEYKFEFNDFQKNEEDPLETDFVILDEASMVDMYLFHSLLKAIKPSTKLIIIGDVDQITSIAEGDVLNDLIQSEKINVSKITKLQRVAEHSKIIKNAYNVRDGKLLEYKNEKGDDFFFIKTNNDNNTLEKIKQMVSSNIKNAFKLNPKNDVIILTPTHEGILGRKNINNIMQNILNPLKPNQNVVKRKNLEFRNNDNVMQTVNNKEENIMNGDCGVITSLYGKEIEVFYNNTLVNYSKNKINELDLAYALTIHKSQGSEYPLVIIPITHGRVFLDVSTFYTGITRGKFVVVVIGSEKNVNKIINKPARKRKTLLKERILELTL